MCPANENSSCWVRVTSPWAGSNYGGIQIPRIDQEIIVDFINSDYDMPYVASRLVNPDGTHTECLTYGSGHVHGGLFSKLSAQQSSLRLNCALMAQSHEQKGLQKLGRIVQDMFGVKN
jgi:uncharacterized protein involved in type VI secretion and phage assembly